VEKVSGVYKITNTKDGKFYIGSSNNIYARIARHKRELIKGIHNNPHLQNAWNKHGADVFSFQILVECDEIKRLEAEQVKIDLAFAMEPNLLYNIAKNTLAPMTGIQSPMKGKNHSAEACAKMSQSHTGKPSPNKGNKYSKETKARISQIHKSMLTNAGRFKPIISEETVLEIRRMYASKKYTQAQIASELGLNRPYVCEVIHNKKRVRTQSIESAKNSKRGDRK
jgi:group I intron endonuclease